MVVTFLIQLLFVQFQFQRKTTQNKKLIRGFTPFWGRDYHNPSPVILLPTTQTFCSIFSGLLCLSLLCLLFGFVVLATAKLAIIQISRCALVARIRTFSIAVILYPKQNQKQNFIFQLFKLNCALNRCVLGFLSMLVLQKVGVNL